MGCFLLVSDWSVYSVVDLWDVYGQFQIGLFTQMSTFGCLLLLKFIAPSVSLGLYDVFHILCTPVMFLSLAFASGLLSYSWVNIFEWEKANIIRLSSVLEGECFPSTGDS